MHLSGVRLSVRLSVPAWVTAANSAVVGPAGRRLLHCAQQRGVRRANAGSATLLAYGVA